MKGRRMCLRWLWVCDLKSYSKSCPLGHEPTLLTCNYNSAQHNSTARMLVSPLFRLTLLLIALVLECSAPKADKSKSARSRGTKSTIGKGLVTDQVASFLARLSGQKLLSPNQVKYWMDTQALPNHQGRLLNNLFQSGTNRSPRLLSLGTNDAGDHMAVSILKPDIETAAMLAGSEYARPKGWNTRNGVVLMLLRSNERPNVIGWLLMKNHNSAMGLKTSSEMVSLDNFEWLHGLSGVIREV